VVMLNDETAVSLLPSLSDDDVDSFFTEQNGGENGAKLT